MKQSGNYKHGEIGRLDGRRVASPEYMAWQHMRGRCMNPKSKDYPYYGGRGITVAARWEKFENFLTDMGRRPTPKHTLDRKNGDLGYSKQNCRWATRQEQARNRDYAKLSMVDARAIRYLWKVRRPGVNRQIDIAQVYGVCQRTISLIVRNEAWKEGEG